MVSHAGAPVDTRGLSMCETCTKQVRKKSCLQLGTLPKQTIGRHFQAMFHITISSLKYLSSKYTFFCIHIGEKRIGTSEDTSNPTAPEERELST
ncbi:hypothetical protein AB205_0154740 [Aquarana catesbeiana]|uniref:Uncharacterized protein n=1 Tax=Aquarana catesbeiana TaxID=8400 RepID=A0A2G9RGC0_AQUCT|nr:hypothetical protein AB205_0154740 [Aquarana catesbeiana]